MAAITKQYTFTNGTIADGTQVNKNFDDLYTLVNGNLDANNIKDGAVTASKLATDSVETAKIKDAQVTSAKLASDAVETINIKDGVITLAKMASSFKGISSIYYAYTDAQNSDANHVTQSITLASTKYVFILGKTWSNYSSGTYPNIQLKKDSTVLDTVTSPGGAPTTLIYYGQITAGTYNITITNAFPAGVSLSNSKLFIVEFSF